MILALFTAACFAVSIWFGFRVRQAYLDMHNPTLGDWTVNKFFTKVYNFVGTAIFAPASFVLMIVSIVNDGEISDVWSTAVAVAFTLLGIFALIFVMVIEALVEDRMRRPQEGIVEDPVEEDMFLHDPRR